MSKLPEFIRFGSLSDLRVREVGDELIVEAVGHHRRVAAVDAVLEGSIARSSTDYGVRWPWEETLSCSEFC